MARPPFCARVPHPRRRGSRGAIGLAARRIHNALRITRVEFLEKLSGRDFIEGHP